MSANPKEEEKEFPNDEEANKKLSEVEEEKE